MFLTAAGILFLSLLWGHPVGHQPCVHLPLQACDNSEVVSDFHFEVKVPED